MAVHRINIFEKNRFSSVGKKPYFAFIIANFLSMAATATVRKNDPIIKAIRRLGVLRSDITMTKEEFKSFALSTEGLQMERESDGTITIMPLVLGGSGKRENLLGFYIRHWQIQADLGEVYGSTTGFDLPDGSTRAPDVAWVSDERLSQFTEKEEEENFIPVPPDFVIELRSASDSLKKVEDKMKNKWMKNGVRLGWLVDPYDELVIIYREDGSEEKIKGFAGRFLSGENIMPGLEVPLDKLMVKKK